MRDELRRTLRSASFRGDGTDLVRALDGVDVSDYLQLAGDGVVAAIADGVDGADDLAGRFIAALGERLWTGDDDLAVDLAAALGTAESPELEDLPVSLEELSEVLEDGHGEGGMVNRHTGEVWSRPAIEYAEETDDGQDFEDSATWLYVDIGYSRPAYRDMEAFIATITDPDIADRLAIAIDGHGAFGRFRRVLERDDDLHTRWPGFSEERRLGRARAWLARNGYRPTHSTRRHNL